jgi:hypothetical protein
VWWCWRLSPIQQLQPRTFGKCVCKPFRFRARKSFYSRQFQAAQREGTAVYPNDYYINHNASSLLCSLLPFLCVGGFDARPIQRFDPDCITNIWLAIE